MEGSLPDQQLVAGPVTRPQTAPRSALRKVPGATRCDPTHFSLLLVGQREAPRRSNGHQPLHRVSGSGHSGRHTQLLKTHAVQPRGRQAQSSTALLRASGEQGARHWGRFGKKPERRKQRWGWPGELLLHIKEEQEAKGTAFWAVGAATAPRQDRAAECGQRWGARVLKGEHWASPALKRGLPSDAGSTGSSPAWGTGDQEFTRLVVQPKQTKSFKKIFFKVKKGG